MTCSYDIDLNLRTTDKQEHLSSQALSSLLPQIFSNTISTFDIFLHIFSAFFSSSRDSGRFLAMKKLSPFHTIEEVDCVRWGKHSLKV